MGSKKTIMRHFVKSAGMCLLLAHSSVHALSISNIRVRSTLNQRFNADIVLSLNAGDNPNDIHVQLAPYDKFSEHGVPWDKELLKLRFEPVQSNHQAIIIRVKSTGAISEPVVVFLLQVSSQKAAIYRQFTVLLDPPADYEPIRIKKQVDMNVRPTRQYHEPQSGFYTPPSERRLPTPPRARVFKPAPEVKRKPDWINVRNNDSLSKIARRLNEAVTPEQMTMALYHANPKAFFSPNINALKAGQILRVPERKVLNDLSASEAKTEFYRQNRAWKDHLSTPAEPQGEAPAVTEAPVQKKLILTAPTEAAVDQNALLISDEINAAIKPLNSVEVLSEKVQGLQERLNKMEQQMANMQKLLLVKDAQLALLQNQESIDPKILEPAHFLSIFTDFFTAASKNLWYVIVGFLELVGFGLIGYYGVKKTKAKKVKSERY
ncbi:FimV family protein [Crenothrix sp.]|uniref:type IV pilus assembly protein FimV n=1 Tax=Crenothrix sp. TaxID=3100433 RepID=UPI00374CA954